MKVVVAGITTLCVLGLIAVALRWLVARSRAKIVLDPTCARCGYITAGLPGSICPECGADLSRAGAVLPPRAVRPLGVWQLMFCWSVVFGVGFMLIEWGWLGRADGVRMIEFEYRWSDPRSGAYDSIKIVCAAEAYRGTAIGGKGVFTIKLLDGRAGRSQLVWGVAKNRSWVTDGKSTGSPTDFGRDAVVAWMGDNGIDIADARVRQEAEGIVKTKFGSNNIHSDAFSSVGASWGAHQRPTRAVQTVRGVLWIGWVAGLVWLWRRSRRAWRVAVVTRQPSVAEQDVAHVDDWDERSLRGFE